MFLSSIFYPLVRNELNVDPAFWYLNFSRWFVKNVSISEKKMIKLCNESHFVENKTDHAACLEVQ
jgi:hypothetical protein